MMTMIVISRNDDDIYARDDDESINYYAKR